MQRYSSGFMITKPRTDLHSSARENIKWPYGRLRFIVHGGHGPWCLISSPDNSVPNHNLAGSRSYFLSWRCCSKACGYWLCQACIHLTLLPASSLSLGPILTPIAKFPCPRLSLVYFFTAGSLCDCFGGQGSWFFVFGSSIKLANDGLYHLPWANQ